MIDDSVNEQSDDHESRITRRSVCSRFQGTRWCGRGNIARDDTELGAYEELDGCCRAHDHCRDYIRPRSEKYGLYNKYICRRCVRNVRAINRRADSLSFFAAHCASARCNFTIA